MVKESGKNNILDVFTKFVISLIFVGFGLWLVHLVYLPDVKAKKLATMAATVTAPKKEGVFRKILKQKGPPLHGHFHMIDEYVLKEDAYQPLCSTCHGTYPHSKEKKVRSLLNFHTGFMACAVCHARKDVAEKDYSYVWMDRETGKTSVTIDAGYGYGKYAAKIFPARVHKDGGKEIIRPVDEHSAREYLNLKDQFTPDQNAQAKLKLHEHISPKPVFCTECHKKNGYLDFAELGFPKNRVDNLASTEVAGMVEKYGTFYLPSVIDFGGN